MPNVLLFGDDRYPALRHEVPLALPDPVAYLEVDGCNTSSRAFSTSRGFGRSTSSRLRPSRSWRLDVE